MNDVRVFLFYRWMETSFITVIPREKPVITFSMAMKPGIPQKTSVWIALEQHQSAHFLLSALPGEKHLDPVVSRAMRWGLSCVDIWVPHKSAHSMPQWPVPMQGDPSGSLLKGRWPPEGHSLLGTLLHSQRGAGGVLPLPLTEAIWAKQEKKEPRAKCLKVVVVTQLLIGNFSFATHSALPYL